MPVNRVIVVENYTDGDIEVAFGSTAYPDFVVKQTTDKVISTSYAQNQTVLELAKPMYIRNVTGTGGSVYVKVMPAGSVQIGKRSGSSGSISIGGTVTGGTDCSVLFVNPAATLAQDNSNFCFETSTNRLGIGTNAPSAILHVNGTVRFASMSTGVGHYDSSGNLSSSLIVNGDITNSTIDLTTKVAGLLPLANGGTNKLTVAAAGAVAWTDADSYEVNTPGSTGQLLRSAGTSAPTWTTATFPVTAGSSGNVLTSDGTNWSSQAAPAASISIGSSIGSSTAGSILFVDGSNDLAQDNSQIFYDTGKSNVQVGSNNTANTEITNGFLYSKDGLAIDESITASIDSFVVAGDDPFRLNYIAGGSNLAQVAFSKVGGSVAAPTDTTLGTTIGRIEGRVFNSSMRTAARIEFIAGAGTQESADISFKTGSASTERLKISDATGSVSINGFSAAGVVTNDSSGNLISTTTLSPTLGGTGQNFSASTGALSVAAGTVSAGTLSLANGGTGQTTKAAAFDALSPMTTSGDIIYGGASGTGTRLASGATNTVLITGPSWGLIANANVDSAAAIAGSKLVAASDSVAGAVSVGTQTFNGDKSVHGVFSTYGGSGESEIIAGNNANARGFTMRYEISSGDGQWSTNGADPASNPGLRLTTGNDLWIQGAGGDTELVLANNGNARGTTLFYNTGSGETHLATNGGTTPSITLRTTAGLIAIPGIGSSTGTALVADGSNNIYKLSSSRKYKKNITYMEKLDAEVPNIYSLRAVRFKPITRGDNPDHFHFGLIAEDVAATIPDLAIYAKDGTPDGVHYDELSVLLLHEVQNLKAIIDDLQARLVKAEEKLKDK